MTDLYVQLVRAYVHHMEGVLDMAISHLCLGCSCERPSQIQHDVCVMMEEEERVRHCFWKCLELVSEEAIMQTFTARLDISAILRCPGTFYTKKFRRCLWSREDWIKDVCREILKKRRLLVKTR